MIFTHTMVVSIEREREREGEIFFLKREKKEDAPLVEFMYLVFTRMPCESYRKRFRSSLLYLCYIFRALTVNSLVC